MKIMFYLIATITIASCSKEIHATDYMTTPSDSTYSVPCSDKILWGEYEVLYKVHHYDNGQQVVYADANSAHWNERDGEMPAMKLNFTQDKLFISQLMQQGWSEGDVSLKWNQCTPVQVGCRCVVEVSATMISWRQNNMVVINYLSKL